MASRGLGTLTLDLVARIGGFVEGLSKAERDLDKRSRAMEKRTAEMAAKFKAAGAAIGVALVGGATAAAVALKSTIDRMDEISKSAARVGISTEEFSKLAYAGGLADVSIESLQGALGKLTKSQAASLKETSQQAKVFDALGISAKNADGSLRSSADVLADFADRFRDMQGSPEAMAAGFALFGKSFQDMVPLIKDGSDGLRAAGDEAERLGIVLSTQAGQDAEAFNDNLTRLKTAADALWTQIAADLLPTLKDLTDQFVELVKEGDLARNIVDLISVSVNAGAGYLTGYMEAWRRVGVAAGAATDYARGYLEVQSQIATLGMADGTIKGGIQRFRDATAAGNAALNNPSLFANVIGGTSSFVTEQEQLRAEAARIKKQREYASKLRAALGEGEGGAAKKRTGGGRSEVEREAEAVARAAQSLNEQLERQIALFGTRGEAARVAYDIENGALAKLLPADKEALLAKAQKLDLLDREKEALDALNDRTNARIEAEARALEGVQAYIEDMQFELSLLGMTNAEREREIALRHAGAAATDTQRQKIVELTDAIREAS